MRGGLVGVSRTSSRNGPSGTAGTSNIPSAVPAPSTARMPSGWCTQTRTTAPLRSSGNGPSSPPRPRWVIQLPRTADAGPPPAARPSEPPPSPGASGARPFPQPATVSATTPTNKRR